jgi:hypothetical protein
MPGSPTDGYIVDDCIFWRATRNAPTPAQTRQMINDELIAQLDSMLVELEADE